MSIPLHKLVTIANLGGFMQAPMNNIKFSCLVFRSVATSFLKASKVVSSSVDSISKNLIAISPCQLPWYTAKEKERQYFHKL